MERRFLFLELVVVEQAGAIVVFSDLNAGWFIPPAFVKSARTPRSEPTS
jgi:hypothetical protein